MGLTFDWAGVLSGAPGAWLVTGFLTTLWITVAASLLASLLAVVLVGLRAGKSLLPRAMAIAVTEIFRNTPLLVQILFWYFVAFTALPAEWRIFISDDHPWATLPGDVAVISPEFLASAWGLAIFSAVYIAEEIRAGLAAVPGGQREAAISQGFGHWATLAYVLLPQALKNAFQPVVGQYLNLMKLSSLATAIGLAEITYQVRQIESYNAHAFEAFAIGTALYLGLGLVMERLSRLLAPGRTARRRQPEQQQQAGHASRA